MKASHQIRLYATGSMMDSSDNYPWEHPALYYRCHFEYSTIQTSSESTRLWINICQEIRKFLQKRNIMFYNISALNRTLARITQVATKKLLLWPLWVHKYPNQGFIFLENCYVLIVDILGVENLKIETTDQGSSMAMPFFSCGR